MPAIVHEETKSHKAKSSYAVGRRKEAVARVYYFVNPIQEIKVNNRELLNYFPEPELHRMIFEPLTLLGHTTGTWSITVIGGGKHGQAESARLGISRILTQLYPDQKSTLRHANLLTRDARIKERKKYGLKRARRAPQWQKR